MPLRLRLQFALVMVSSVFATVVIGYGGLTLFGEWQTAKMLSDFSPNALRAMQAVEAGQVPNLADGEAFVVEGRQLEMTLNRNQNLALLVLSIAAATIGGVLGVLFSNRLVRPIEAVAQAAQQIAAGDLSTRVTTATKGAGEITQLVEDFNTMATALEAYERELSAHTAAIAHELRTPLTVLRGYVQGAADGVFQVDAAHFTRLLGQIETLTRLVEDLRTLSLADIGKLSLDMQTVDLAEIVEVAAETMAQLCAESGMAIERDLRAAPMQGDAPRMQQALVAVIENARRHASSGKTVRIETRAQADRAIVRVLDQGPGLPPENLVHVFDRFWRADVSRSKETGGSGLGLSIVKAIAEAHGGSVHLFNREGGGLGVELSFPVVSA
jgi:signal transduction histidine kinase